MNALAGMAAAAAALSGMLAAALERTPRTLGALEVAKPVEKAASGPRRAVRLVASLAGAVGFLVAGVVGCLLGVCAVVVGLRIRLRVKTRRAERMVREQLPDALSAVAAALRAGMSLSRAVSFAAESFQGPLGAQLRAVIERETMGVSLSASLETWCASLPGQESRLLATVLDLHQRAGGEFAAVLERVVRTLQAREGIEREVRSLTAQGRLSGTILGVLPFAFLAFLMMTAPKDMVAAFRSTVGAMALVVGLAMQGLAFWWIRSLLRVAQ